MSSDFIQRNGRLQIVRLTISLLGRIALKTSLASLISSPATAGALSAAPLTATIARNDLTTAQQTAANGSALLFNADASSPGPISGEVTWLPVTASLNTVLNGSAGFTATQLKIAIVISRNTDKTVPTAQIIHIRFKTSQQPVREVPTILVRRNSDRHGTMLHGSTVRIMNNIALFGASPVPSEQADNVALLGSASWLDFPVIYANGHKGVVSMEVNDACRKALVKIFSSQ
jgi:hypothetical protein